MFPSKRILAVLCSLFIILTFVPVEIVSAQNTNMLMQQQRMNNQRMMMQQRQQQQLLQQQRLRQQEQAKRQREQQRVQQERMRIQREQQRVQRDRQRAQREQQRTQRDQQRTQREQMRAERATQQAARAQQQARRTQQQRSDADRKLKETEARTAVLTRQQTTAVRSKLATLPKPQRPVTNDNKGAASNNNGAGKPPKPPVATSGSGGGNKPPGPPKPPNAGKPPKPPVAALASGGGKKPPGPPKPPKAANDNVKFDHRKVGPLVKPAIVPKPSEARLIASTEGLMSSRNSRFSGVKTGSYGDRSTKYIWTIDQRGVNIVKEIGGKTTYKHTNLSSSAAFGGEVWFKNSRTVVINSGSGRFGDGNPNVGRSNYQAAVKAWESLGYKVEAKPFRERY